MNVTRRAFFRFVLAVPLLGYVAPAFRARVERLSFADIVTETLRNSAGQVADNVMAHNALFSRLQAKNAKPSRREVGKPR